MLILCRGKSLHFSRISGKDVVFVVFKDIWLKAPLLKFLFWQLWITPSEVDRGLHMSQAQLVRLNYMFTLATLPQAKSYIFGNTTNGLSPASPTFSSTKQFLHPPQSQNLNWQPWYCCWFVHIAITKCVILSHGEKTKSNPSRFLFLYNSNYYQRMYFISLLIWKY